MFGSPEQYLLSIKARKILNLTMQWLEKVIFLLLDVVLWSYQKLMMVLVSILWWMRTAFCTLLQNA